MEHPCKKGIRNIEYYRRRRRKCKRLQICPSHPSEKVVPGKTRCPKCLLSFMEFTNNQRKKKLCFSHRDVAAVPGKNYYQKCLNAKRLKWLRLKGVNEVEIEKARKALEIFDGVCQCCGTNNPQTTRKWTLDHNHKTGKFRGIICANCNISLGHAKDDPVRLEMMAAYLKKNKYLTN